MVVCGPGSGPHSTCPCTGHATGTSTLRGGTRPGKKNANCDGPTTAASARTGARCPQASQEGYLLRLSRRCDVPRLLVCANLQFIRAVGCPNMPHVSVVIAAQCDVNCMCRFVMFYTFMRSARVRVVTALKENALTGESVDDPLNTRTQAQQRPMLADEVDMQVRSQN